MSRTTINPFADVQRIERTARRVRMPVPLLLSRHHSPLAVMAYGLLDVMGSPARPVEAGRRWIAARLGCSVDGLAKALGALGREHASTGPLVPDSPRWLTTVRRGNRRTAQRATVAGVPYVDVPMWTLDPDLGAGEGLDPRVWRFYALLLHMRHADRGTVALARRELAALARVREETVTAYVRRLEAAGLVLAAARPGSTTLLLPVTVPLDAAALDAVRARLDRYSQAVHNACSERDHDCPQDPPAGTSPPTSGGTSPHPSTGTTKRDPLYGDPPYGDPAPARAFAPSALAPADEPVPARPPSSVRTWCGTCPSPSRRIETDPDTGRPTGRPCPRCGSGAGSGSERAA